MRRLGVLLVLGMLFPLLAQENIGLTVIKAVTEIMSPENMKSKGTQTCKEKETC